MLTIVQVHNTRIQEIAAQYGISGKEAAVYALLTEQQLSQMWQAEVVTRLYYAGQLLDSDSYLSDTSTLADSEGPATPPPEFEDRVVGVEDGLG